VIRLAGGVLRCIVGEDEEGFDALFFERSELVSVVLEAVAR
jgi:hypothetical protein